MEKYKLVLNCGSSSLKFALYKNNGDKIFYGNFEKIGISNSFLKYKYLNETKKIEFSKLENHIEVLKNLFNLFSDFSINISDIDSIGHRIVHGGGEFEDSVICDSSVILKLEKTKLLAPLHNKVQIEVVEYCFNNLKNIKQVLCFDTSFHSTIPEKAYRYAIPYEFFEENKIRKYGFHGLSYQYSLEKYSQKTNIPKNELNLIICHLGSGSSICAIKNGKSIDTSMGLTPMDGLVMGTRSGDIDPGILIHLINTLNYSPSEVDNILNKKSGLAGITGLSDIDMRDVLYLADFEVSDYDISKISEKFSSYSSEDLSKLKNRCKLAIDIMVYRIKKYIGAYFAILGRVDAIIFTAGIGERSFIIRNLILEDLEILKNVNIEVIEADEEYIIFETLLNI
ncbi:acetate/propionate family kinase [Patescibacteria group bacterium]|nr:acetate/propionate family kinase [Patescibacteria group bacterium]